MLSSMFLDAYVSAVNAGAAAGVDRHTYAARRYFLREVSVALGFAGLGIMALQFALTARIGKVNRPFGSDVVYHFHRQISIVAFVLILAHPIILFVTDPETIALLNIFTAPWRARFATVGLVALIAIIVTSVWRKQLKIDYYAWKIAHGLAGNWGGGVCPYTCDYGRVLHQHALETGLVGGIWCVLDWAADLRAPGATDLADAAAMAS
jgi:hypothetical protein